jgi:archaellum component FlaG (FlaF/FlaG flagellin family)
MMTAILIIAAAIVGSAVAAWLCVSVCRLSDWLEDSMEPEEYT